MRSLIAIVTVALATYGAPAIASNGMTVEEITITAQRRDSTVERLPAAVSTLGAQELAARGVDRAQNLQYAVPSLTVGRSFGEVDLAIRGVGRAVGAPSVGVYVDGVYRPFPATQDVALIDLERVEVLRGPQGTLYGRNANAGVVNFVTAAPTDERFGWVQGGYAQYDDMSIQGMFNTPLSERVRVRANARHEQRDDGYVENIGDGPNVDLGEVTSGHVRLLIDANDALSFDIGVGGFRREGAFDYVVPRAPFRADVIAANPVLQDVQFPHHPWDTSTGGPADGERTLGSAQVTTTWRAEGVTLRSITAYQNLDTDWNDDRDGISAPFTRGHQVEHNETFTQELTLSGETNNVDWVTGVFYLADRGDSSLRVTLQSGVVSGPVLVPVNTFIERTTPHDDTDAAAWYADATLNLGARFRVFGGVRQSEDELDVENHRRRGLLPNTTVADLCPTTTDYDVQFSETTFRLGGQLDVANAQQVYASFSNGFKDGGVNIGSCNDEFEPESIDAWELGYKATWLDGAMSLRTAAFVYDYKDFQVSQRAGLQLSITNAAAADVKGIEAEIDWRPDEHWTLRAALAFLDARYTDFENQDGLNPALGVQDLSGNALSDAPDRSGLIHIAYRTDPFSFGNVTLGLAAAARSKMYYREFNAPEEAQSGYTVLDAYLLWDSPNERYRVRVYGNNLNNADYFTTLGSSDVFGSHGGTFGPPRQIGAELRVRF